jgi:HD superfamily phosphodiesterase
MQQIINQQSDRVRKVWQNVTQLYSQTKRKEAFYLWKNHVQTVAKFAAELSDRFGGKKDLVVVGALLHDVADIWLEREDNAFEARTRGTIEEVLKEASFSFQETTFVMDEIIDPHSCHPDNLPSTLEGKVLATADALAHLTTTFYADARTVFFLTKKTDAEYLEWVKSKLYRDFNKKIFFEEIKKEISPRHQELIKQFSI